MARNIWPLVQNRNEEDGRSPFSEWRFPLGRVPESKCRPACLSVSMSVQRLSLITPERMVGSGRDKHQKMRQSAGTTMAFVTWRHVPRGTCHVPPREPLAKPNRKDQIFERNIAEIWNFQGRCTSVWYTCHVSDDPEGSKLCPQGTIAFFSLMPSSSDTLRARDTKFGTGGELDTRYPVKQKNWTPQI